MNYPQSSEILEKIRAAKRVYIACHVHPDPDSVGSALSMKLALNQLAVPSTIVGVDPLPDYLRFLPLHEGLTQIDFDTFAYEEGDLFLLLDMSGWGMLYGAHPENRKEFDFIRIDHHQDDTIVGGLSIAQNDKSSTSEILTALYEDWNVNITSEMATCLLTGVVGDSGSFQYEHTNAATHATAAKLYSLGADHEAIYLALFRSAKFESYKLLGLLIENMEFEKDNAFVWSAIPFEQYQQFTEAEKTPFLDIIVQSVMDTKFGIRMIEKSPGVVNIAFRSRFPKEVDVSTLAQQFGGGGHRAASGAIQKGDYQEIVDRVIAQARVFSKNV